MSEWKRLIGTTIQYREQPIEIEEKKAVAVLYTNWRDETAWRIIYPLPCHPEFHSPEATYYPNEWILRVWDLEKNAERSYALSGIKDWKSIAQLEQIFPPKRKEQ